MKHAYAAFVAVLFCICLVADGNLSFAADKAGDVVARMTDKDREVVELAPSSYGMPAVGIKKFSRYDLNFSIDLSGFREIIVADGPYMKEPPKAILGTFSARFASSSTWPGDEKNLYHELELYVIVKNPPTIAGKAAETSEQLIRNNNFYRQLRKNGSLTEIWPWPERAITGAIFCYPQEIYSRDKDTKKEIKGTSWHFDLISLIAGRVLLLQFAADFPLAAPLPKGLLKRIESILSTLRLISRSPVSSTESAIAAAQVCLEALVQPRNPAPAVSVTEALDLADQYLAVNQIDTTGYYLYSIELIYVKNVRTWRVLWSWIELMNDMRMDLHAEDILEVFVTNERTVYMSGRSRLAESELKNMQANEKNGKAENASLSGELTLSKEGSAVPGASVSVKSEHSEWLCVKTNEDGAFQFSSLKPGVYYLKASLEGFDTIYRRLILKKGQTRHFNLSIAVSPIIEPLAPFKKFICGTIFVGNHEPFPGVTVSLEANGNLIKKTVSEKTGNFCLDRLKAGVYTLRFSAKDFLDIVKSVVIGAEDATKFGELHFPFSWQGPNVPLRAALTLADQYLAANHIDTSGHYLRSIRLMNMEHVITWRVLWDRKLSYGIPLAVCVTMDQSACKCSLFVNKSPISPGRNDMTWVAGGQVEKPHVAGRRDKDAIAAMEGCLTLSDGSAVSGYEVTLTSRSGQCTRVIQDEKGIFRFEYLVPDVYLLHITLPGFFPIVRIITLKAGEINKMELEAKIISTKPDVFVPKLIMGTVFIGDRISFPGVQVALESSEGERWESRTNDEGGFFFHSLKNGSYRLRFSVSGCQDIVKTVTVGPVEPKVKMEIHFPLPWEAGNE